MKEFNKLGRWLKAGTAAALYSTDAVCRWFAKHFAINLHRGNLLCIGAAYNNCLLKINSVRNVIAYLIYEHSIDTQIQIRIYVRSSVFISSSPQTCHSLQNGKL